MTKTQSRLYQSVVVMFLLAFAGASAFGLSVEGRFALGSGSYDLLGGATVYDELAKWQLYSVGAELPLAGLGRIIARYSTGSSSDISIQQGAPVTDPTGVKSQQLVGGELVLNPVPAVDIGAGVGYFSDRGTNTWRAQHPGGPGVPPFAPGDTLDWTVRRQTTGMLLLLSAGVDLGSVYVGARAGYGPSMAWTETLRAEKGAAWEQWAPETTPAQAALYEANARFNLPGGFAIVGGVQGSSLNNPALDQLKSAYSNSNDEQAEIVDTDVSQALEGVLTLYAGLRYTF